MLRDRRLLGLVVLLAAMGCQTHTKAPRSAEAQKEIAEARAAFETADPEVKKFFETAHGYVLFPHVGKGGFILGAGGGAGYVFEKGTLIGTARVTIVTAGALIGGQGFRQVIFFEKPENLETFKQENFELGAEVSAVALSAGAALHAKYEQGVLIFTVPIGGLMAEASVKGQGFDFEPLPPEEPAAPAKPAACPQCQAAVVEGTKFCVQCGAKL